MRMSSSRGPIRADAQAASMSLGRRELRHGKEAQAARARARAVRRKHREIRLRLAERNREMDYLEHQTLAVRTARVLCKSHGIMRIRRFEQDETILVCGCRRVDLKLGVDFNQPKLSWVHRPAKKHRPMFAFGNDQEEIS
jgi:hypothetical protein